MKIFYVHDSNSKYRVLDDEINIFHSKTFEYITLDEVGSEIWNLIKIPKTFDDIFKYLIDIYEVENQLLENDIKNWLYEAEERNLIKVFEK